METRIVAAWALLLLAARLPAQESADSLAQKARFFSAGEKQRIAATLTVELGTEKKIRELELFFLSSAGSDKLLARITAPAFLREMKVLLNSSGSQWNTWIKTSQGVKRLGTGTRGESLFQSDFLTSDFIIPQTGWIFEGDDRSTGFRILKRNGERGEDFRTQHLHLRTADSVIVRRVFYNAEGTAIREYTVVDWESISGSADRPARIELVKHPAKGRSVLDIRGVFTEERFPEGLFLPGSL